MDEPLDRNKLGKGRPGPWDKESNKKNTKTDKSKSKVEKKTVFHKKSDAGKGDVPRRGISLEEWSDRWDKIYGVGKYKKEK